MAAPPLPAGSGLRRLVLKIAAFPNWYLFGKDAQEQRPQVRMTFGSTGRIARLTGFEGN